ncbi:hypothetical protein Ae201684P_016733 [Aphanomyces euteiches]|uniref:Uncharacterized protein n=1 Tax=Aphanomyces euteiches TaxID=100861 RepID=A0A6G0XHX2_9STRA|nr:hypothetical protein Ae201684_004573 [Aphanomyces euteiches]KAH9094118.1 hypothetical protein Ae201684P_016733 [Aphanomyces euteiches]
MDPLLCSLINFAVHVEQMASASVSDFVNGNPDDGHRVVRKLLDDTFKSQSFNKLRDGNLGTHSLRKGAATYASRNGVPKDFVNRRGRWRSSKQIVDIYIDTTLAYPDACAAASLAGPAGPCIYVAMSEFACVTHDFLVDEVAPTVKRTMGPMLAKTLAMPLLWASFQPREPEKPSIIPEDLKSKIMHAYRRAGGSTEACPIRRIGIHVAGEGGQLNLIELQDIDVDNTRDRSDTMPRVDRNDMTAMHTQLLTIKRYMLDVMNELQRVHSTTRNEMQKMATVLNRIAIQPVVRSARSFTSSPAIDERQQVSRLSKRPKDLYTLWHEYQFGCNGFKPAKDFTAVERGANKFAYSRRKLFWDLISKLVRAGYTSDAAIVKVYHVFGRSQSVSNILLALRTHKQQGGHPALQL